MRGLVITSGAMGAVIQTSKGVNGFLERVARAICKPAMKGLAADLDPAFGLHALDGRVVELVAVGGFGHHALLGIGNAWCRQAKQQRHRVLRLWPQRVAPLGRRPATIHTVTSSARARNEMRAQAIARGGGCRCLNPVAFEEQVANDKKRALRIAQVGQQEEKRIASGGKHRAAAADLFTQRIGIALSARSLDRAEQTPLR
jgi:hypothetical protein